MHHGVFNVAKHRYLQKGPEQKITNVEHTEMDAVHKEKATAIENIVKGMTIGGNGFNSTNLSCLEVENNSNWRLDTINCRSHLFLSG